MITPNTKRRTAFMRSAYMDPNDPSTMFLSTSQPPSSPAVSTLTPEP